MLDIIIVGAGVAGLSASIGLRRAGHKVTVLEQSSLLHETGAAITISPNASRVLHLWGFDPKKSKMVVVDGVSIVDGMTMENIVPRYFDDIEGTYGVPIYSTHRVDLHDQLRELATREEGPGRPVDVQTRARVKDYDAAQGKVTLEDERVLQGDIVVAADGVHSIAVEHVAPNLGDRTMHSGWGTMRWLLPTEDLSSDPETAPLVEEGTQRYFTAGRGNGALVWYQCRNNEVQNFLYLSKEFNTENATEDYHAGVDASVLREAATHDFSPAVQAVIGKAKEVKFWKLVPRTPLPKWHKDRLVLIGDAAHPMLPFIAQGGAQAIEDGAALSILLDGVNDKETMEERLQLFEQVRRNRGSSLQLISNSSHPQPQSVRDDASKFLPGDMKFENAEDVTKYTFTFDVLKESQAVLAA